MTCNKTEVRVFDYLDPIPNLDEVRRLLSCRPYSSTFRACDFSVYPFYRRNRDLPFYQPDLTRRSTQKLVEHATSSFPSWSTTPQYPPTQTYFCAPSQSSSNSQPHHEYIQHRPHRGPSSCSVCINTYLHHFPADFSRHPAELFVHTTPRTNAHPVLHPGEHINKIMGYLHNDKRTLSVAVAVCKQWTWAGRHLLWDDVKPKEVVATVSSHRRQQYYATFIRILDFDWSEAVFGSLNVSHLEFSNLQTLSLHEEHLKPRGSNVMLALITPAL